MVRSGFEEDFDLNLGEKRCGYDEVVVVDDRTIQILVCLPVKSLLRFKAVCKSWCALIESSFFINLHISSSSSSKKFGSFILHVEVDKSERGLRENALLMLSSSESESESEFRSSEFRSSESRSSEFRSSESRSSEFRSSESRSSESRSSESGSVVCWWSTDPDVRRGGRWGSNWRKKRDGEEDNDDDDDDKSDDQVFEVDNNNFRLDSLGFPSCYKSSASPRVIGSCNGLICLYHGRIYDRKNMEFSLWNPGTRQFRILPKSIIIHEEDGGGVGADRIEENRNNGVRSRCSYLIAFGFDVKTKDYKVVLVTGFKPKKWFAARPMECPCRVQVYSLCTDSWRILEGITCLPGYPFFDNFEGQYLNGSCFFMAKFFHAEQHPIWNPKNNRFIISLDLTKEIITTIQIPDHDTNQKLYLSYLGDQMALFTVSNPNLTFDGVHYYLSGNYDHEDYDIWVLNEHGSSSSSSSSVNKDSWKNLYSFQIKCVVPGPLNLLNIPKGISNDGVFALIETKGIAGLGKKMKLYNLVTKEMKKNFLVCHGVMSRAAEVYKPSLVSIIGGNGRHSSSSSSSSR